MKRIFEEFIKGGNVELFEKLAENKWFVLGLVIVIALAVAAIAVFSRKKGKNDSPAEIHHTESKKKVKKMTPKVLVTGAMCVGLSFILSCIRLWHMPQGGGITLVSSLPLIMFSYIYGWQPGICASFTYSILQMIQTPGNIMNPAQALLDYVIAFSVLGVAGFLKNNKNIVPSVVICYTLRYLAHVSAGIIWYRAYNATTFSGVPYCFLYNGVFMLPEMILCIIVVILPPVKKMITRLKTEFA